MTGDVSPVAMFLNFSLSNATLRGSHGLSAQKARRTMSSRPKGSPTRSGGPTGPLTSCINIYFKVKIKKLLASICAMHCQVKSIVWRSFLFSILSLVSSFYFGWHCSVFVPLMIFEIQSTCALTLFHRWSMMSEFGPQGLAIPLYLVVQSHPPPATVPTTMILPFFLCINGPPNI